MEAYFTLPEGKHPLHDFYSGIYRRYDLINRIFTLGMDKRWRRITVDECIRPEVHEILDLCCGTGDLTVLLAKSSQQVQVTGYDFSEPMLSIARRKTTPSIAYQIRYIQGNADSMPFAGETFHRITIGFGFRNLVYQNPNASRHIHEINRVLKLSGQILILESAVPGNRLLRLLYKTYLHGFLIPIGGLLSGNWKAYRYLAHSSINYFSPPELRQFLSENGFTILKIKNFIPGAASLVVAEKTRNIEHAPELPV